MAVIFELQAIFHPYSAFFLSIFKLDGATETPFVWGFFTDEICSSPEQLAYDREFTPMLEMESANLDLKPPCNVSCQLLNVIKTVSQFITHTAPHMATFIMRGRGSTRLINLAQVHLWWQAGDRPLMICNHLKASSMDRKCGFNLFILLSSSKVNIWESQKSTFLFQPCIYSALAQLCPSCLSFISWSTWFYKFLIPDDNWSLLFHHLWSDGWLPCLTSQPIKPLQGCLSVSAHLT